MVTGNSTRYIAFDLGAESGRAIVSWLKSGVLDFAEVRRFPNTPVRAGASLRWNLPQLWSEMRAALTEIEDDALRIDGVGVDTWGCDYALLDGRGELVGLPYCYRDARTDGVMEALFERVPRARIYEATGIQFLPFNTLYQLAAAVEKTPDEIAAAQSFGTIPDVLNYFLTGVLRAEFTNATTTQMVDARTRGWATALLDEVGIPTRLLPPIVEPGSALGGLRIPELSMLDDVPVVAPACHDTGSAVAAIPAGNGRAFVSSGTWSLLGTEVAAPIVTPAALEANFTNEGGVCGTTRLLKNIAGLWLLQECRRGWARAGAEYSYAELMDMAADDRHAFRSLVDPDDPSFLHPADMAASIKGYCARTGQPAPHDPPSFARAILESLAFKYRVVVDAVERLTGVPITEIQIVGGGSRNRVLNQFTADATGRTVIAGPVEATALGNIAMQMLATGAVSSLVEARAIIERSFPVERFVPRAAEQWDVHYGRFKHYVELSCV
jgi:rhamnulokinase